jgi:hypothetical protein
MVSGHPSSGAKRSGRESDYSLLSSVEVKNGGATPPLPDMSYILINLFVAANLWVDERASFEKEMKLHA